ncbi:BBM_1a_G0011830.mRNA.1.CDS.1 [Saccharomyces cerevisiae]|nr:Mrp1p [Saccharomyces cerevisiae YJM1399]CAI4366746.1 ADE_G0011770.mRNA.1.CDS.1 [Saccharomyces cerevisiae]CAI4368135.1 BBM_1a_G0011830.mRNA.1.CDS.1 [Saccharomyces cerevisiae]CAI6574394.1 ADE_G0011770.mRNA.1.CDS.1 [Saccharomyces cerevisiae]CAI7079637.1 BBM_1a_G0011830.mRNA.1.CDS.1 [Saccharomyces cerevisiae]
MLRFTGARAIRKYSTRYALEHLKEGAPLKGLFSIEGLQKAWFDRVKYLDAKLNDCTNEAQQKPLETLIHENSKSASKKHIVNYASSLYNLKFSMSSLQGCIRTLPEECPRLGPEALLQTPDFNRTISNEPLTTGNERLQAALISSFGSLMEFRTLLINSNLAISGDGFTWLVARRQLDKRAMRNDMPNRDIEYDKLFILNTYNAGTPFNFSTSGVMNELNNQYTNMEKQRAKEAGNLEDSEMTAKQAKTKFIYETQQKGFSGKEVSYIPLLAIDASPKTWLTDYGVFGKREYLERVWDSIEWKIVESRLPQRTKIQAFNTL